MIKFYKTLFFLSLLLLPALSFQANADGDISKLELSPGNLTLKPGSVIKLKSLILQSKSAVDVDAIQLLAMEVLAKSKQGNGTIRLRVGKKYSAWLKVAGTQNNFDKQQAESYTNIKIRSPGGGKQQVWQLLVNGFVRIKKITLYTTTVSSDAGSI